ncbi:MAG TPA: alpha-galactosidase, partial [Terriglobales bacterium]|nr:alpha-galactosidase [Terriglobales bacterium]
MIVPVARVLTCLKFLFLLLCCLAIAATNGCSRQRSASNEAAGGTEITVITQPGTPIVIKSSSAEFRVLPSGYIQAELLSNGKPVRLDDPHDANSAAGDSVISAGKEIRDFKMDLENATVSDASARLGKKGKRIEFTGQSTSLPALQKTMAIEVYEDFPSLALSSTSYKNTGNADIQVDQVLTQQHLLNASLSDQQAAPYSMWSFHGSSEAWGKDDVMKITDKFVRANPMQTMMSNDENRTGGGIPVVAFWTGSVGEAIGHAEVVPLKLSLPVKAGTDGRVNAGVTMDANSTLSPGQVYATPLTFVSVFHGDFYEALRMYSRMLQVRGLSLAHPDQSDYEANWCGWGYEMDFTPKQMVDTIPKLKEMGIKWATLDAGWFRARGDWDPRPDTFPDDSMRKVVKTFHDAGIRMTIWWIPIVTEDGRGKDILNHRSYQMTKVVKEHPDWLILDKDGKPARATADLGALCPAVPDVQQYYKQLTEKFIRDWDFDGHKLDFSYTVPACYNPKHHHKSPNDSIAAVGDVYKIILETTRALKPESVTQACPCGTPPSLAWLPYIDQAVTADPVGSRQVRLRTKMYKALLGPEAAVYGDHVELTEVDLSNMQHEVDKGRDFASEVGVGAVVGTKFTVNAKGPKFKTV